MIATCNPTKPNHKRRSIRSPSALRQSTNFLNQINLIFPVQSSPQKYSPSRYPQITLITRAPHPLERGAYRDRHETLGWGAVDAAASGAQAAVFRERSTACRRTALKASARTSAGRKWPVEWFGEGSCVRQNRVVLAPVAGVKSAEVFAKPNRVRKTVNSPMTEARRIRLRGERGISRQTIAQGRPDALRWTCMLVCALLCAIAHGTAGAARTRSSLRPHRARASVKPRAHRAASSRLHAHAHPPGCRYPRAE